MKQFNDMENAMSDFTFKMGFANAIFFLVKWFGFLWIMDYYGFIKPFVKALTALYN